MRSCCIKAGCKLLISFSLIIIIQALQSFSLEKKVNEGAISDFSLQSTDGKHISLKDYPEAKGFIIVFICNACPFARLYTGRLNELYEKGKTLNIPLLAINSSDTALFENENFAAMKEHAKAANFDFPYLYDAKQSVLKNFKADRTPEAFVLWKQKNHWKINYRGAIDDNGAEPAKATHHYVTEAIDELLAGKPVSIAETHSVGCSILYRKG